MKNDYIDFLINYYINRFIYFNDKILYNNIFFISKFDKVIRIYIILLNDLVNNFNIQVFY